MHRKRTQQLILPPNGLHWTLHGVREQIFSNTPSASGQIKSEMLFALSLSLSYAYNPPQIHYDYNSIEFSAVWKTIMKQSVCCDRATPLNLEFQFLCTHFCGGYSFTFNHFIAVNAIKTFMMCVRIAQLIVTNIELMDKLNCCVNALEIFRNGQLIEENIDTLVNPVII